MSQKYLVKLQSEQSAMLVDYDLFQDKLFLGESTNYKTQIWIFHLFDSRDGAVSFRIQNKKNNKFIVETEDGIGLKNDASGDEYYWMQIRNKDSYQFSNKKTHNFLSIKDETVVASPDPHSFVVFWEFNNANSVNFPLPRYAPHLIAIDGFKRSGKTAISNEIGKHLVYPVSSIISFDNYVDCSGNLSELMLKELYQDLLEELSRKRTCKCFVIIEGFDILRNPALFHLADFSLFVGCNQSNLWNHYKEDMMENEFLLKIWPQMVQHGMNKPRNTFLLTNYNESPQFLFNIAERINKKILERNSYHFSLKNTFDMYQLMKKNDMDEYRSVLFDKILGMTFGIALGGAKGTPFEYSDYKKIHFLRENQDRIKLAEKWSCGTYHYLCVLASIASNKTIQSKEIASELLKDFNEKKSEELGKWGAVTVDSLKRLKDKKSYLESGDLNSDGCGALTKMIPLAFYASNQGKEAINIDKEVQEVTGITHNSSICKYASQMFVYLGILIFDHPDVLFSEEKRKQVLHHLIQYSENLQKSFEFNFEPITKNLKDFKQKFEELDSDEKFLSVLPNKTNCLHSLATVIGILLGSEPSMYSILRACYLGGDGETNASLVGGILGAAFGTCIFDGFEEELEKLDQKEYLMGRSLDIYEIWKGMKKSTPQTGGGFFSKLFKV